MERVRYELQIMGDRQWKRCCAIALGDRAPVISRWFGAPGTGGRLRFPGGDR